MLSVAESSSHGVSGRPAEVQPEAGVDRLDRGDGVGGELLVGHVAELRRVVPCARGGEPFQAAGPGFQLVLADHGASERVRPPRGGLRGQAADRRDRGPGRPVRLDHQRVGVDR